MKQAAEKMESIRQEQEDLIGENRHLVSKVEHL